jgi:hypothetical protein
MTKQSAVALKTLQIMKKRIVNQRDCFFPRNDKSTRLKDAYPLSKFLAISSANTSGSGRLSKSASNLSFSQAMSKNVLSLAIISS